MSKKILIIDDDQDLLDIMELYFKSEGFEVQTATAANDIIKMANDGAPDVIILDYFLKKNTNGGELCHLLKRHYTTKHIPVIIFSASHKVGQFLTKYKFDQFIAKPFDLLQLIDQVKSMIKTNSVLVNI